MVPVVVVIVKVVPEMEKLLVSVVNCGGVWQLSVAVVMVRVVEVALDVPVDEHAGLVPPPILAG